MPDDLQALLDSLTPEDRRTLFVELSGPAEERRLAGRHEAALEAFRVDPSDDNKAIYRQATADLQAHRTTVRADRPGVGVGGDAVPSGHEGA